MRISTKGRYALRMMCDIAIHHNNEPIPLKEIAERQHLSTKYLEQIVILLSRAGFVKSVRGSRGGYKLSDTPDHYTVGMILRLTEGSMSPVSCLDDEKNECERSLNCPTLFVWKKLNDAICDVIDNITIQDIIDNTPDAGNNYCI